MEKTFNFYEYHEYNNDYIYINNKVGFQLCAGTYLKHMTANKVCLQ